jgi:hypothetical protein
LRNHDTRRYMGMTINLKKTNRRPRTESGAADHLVASETETHGSRFPTGKVLTGVLLFNALSAIGGGIGLVTGTLPVPTLLLRHTPFDSFVVHTKTAAAYGIIAAANAHDPATRCGGAKDGFLSLPTAP